MKRRTFIQQAFLICGTALFVACAGAPQPAQTAEVRLIIEPATARVYTDERFVGGARVLATRAVSFRAGPRRLTITADGFFPHDLDLDLPPGTTTVRVTLRPIPN